MARLDRLVTAKAVAQYASVIGRQFSYTLLQAVAQLDESTLQRELGRLVEAELLYQRGLPPQATYTFKHALIQDAAYASLLRSTKQGYHLRIAEVLEERFPETAEHQPALLAHHCVEAGLNEQAIFGHTLLHLGEFSTAHTHLEQGLTVYASEHPRSLPPLSTSGQDLETFCLSWLASALWFLGYPEQAVQRDNEALALAQAREHLFNLMNTLNYSSRLHRWRGERHLVEERLEASMALSTAYGFAQQAAIGKIEWGFVLTEHGDSAGLALMHEGLTAYRATGSVVRQPWYLAQLAEAHGKVGQAEEGLTALTEALALVNDTNERWWEAELYRLKGELLLQQSSDNAAESETCFHQAIAIAQSQQAKSWELRAATSLAKLWQNQGKRQEAYDLLASVYGWCTEGFDTADLKDAKALLDALA